MKYFPVFRQQLLSPSSGIGNGYSDCFESVRKQLHLDILPSGFSFLDVKQNQTSRCCKSHINISRFPPFNVPTKHTNSTWCYNSHFTPICFDVTQPQNAIFKQCTPSLKHIEINWTTLKNFILFSTFCCWEKAHLIYFRIHFIIFIY